MAFDPKQYAELLLNEAGASETQKQAFMELIGNDKFSKKLSTDVLMQSDYNRNMDALRNKEKETSNYYQQLVQWKAEQDAMYAGLQVRPQLDQQPTGDFISKKDFEDFRSKLGQENQQREANFIAVTKKVGRLASRHANEFHEELDTDALEKIVIEQKVDLDRAYDLMVGERRKAASDASFAERIKRERDEAVREFASTRQIPIDSTPKETGVYGHVNFTKPPEDTASMTDGRGNLTPLGYGKVRSGFVEEYNNWSRGGSQQ